MLAHAIDSDRRTAVRHPVDYPVLARRRAGGDIGLRIVNVSPAGFLAHGEPALGVGDRVTLRLPVIGEIEAQLAWGDRRRAGFHFERVVRLGDFTRMFIAMQPQRIDRD